MDHETTLSFAGDTAKAFFRLFENEAAFGEAFTLSSAEHHTWREIASMYEEIGGLRYIEIDDRDFIDECCRGNVYAWQQLRYDRCFDRVIDNGKLLAVTGMKQEDFTPLEIALRDRLTAYDGMIYDKNLNDAMDECLRKREISE
ncbi:MAG: hypothetical protein KBT31_00865 [Firmicutes bacterium]|nr:hypothetical protein [Candidatus Colimorpha enterica]